MQVLVTGNFFSKNFFPPNKDDVDNYDSVFGKIFATNLRNLVYHQIWET